MKKNSLTYALESLEIEKKAIEDMEKYLDKNAFEAAVNLICSSEKIITSGSGSTGIATKKFAHTLCCIERNGIFLSPAEAPHGGMGCIKANDTVVLASRGGKTSELIPIMEVTKKKGAKLITVTENVSSPLARAADIVLPMKIERESDPLNVMATSSFVATIALFDALIAAVMNETDYSLDQFAIIHPGGAVGERLTK